MLSFAAITPHPPLLVPEVGGASLAEIPQTVAAMKKLGKFFAQEKPKVVFLTSPHTIFSGEQFNLLAGQDLSGSLEMFGAPEVQLTFGGDQALAQKIQARAQKSNALQVKISDFFELDHASIVPLYYLSQKHDRFHLVVSSFSSLALKEHFAYGQIVGKTILNYPKKVAIVASGDLSHRLSPTAPGGFSRRGQEFDRTLVKLIAENDVKGLLQIDQDLVEQAGECGLRSIIILFGVLSAYTQDSGKNYRPQILAYEGPFGVGYLTAYFKLEG